ncbi:proline--tRNA ligase [candidate division KSB1 bacterium]|nr:proline--tRNA ligase [candidate division KSB1 bacterium]
MKNKITRQSEDFSRWYNDLVLQAELADYSPVKGCMVIRPNGYAIWEKMQAELDRMFKETGHQNAYFPLFIPESFMKKEAEHVKGFAPQCAIVTIGGDKVLEERLYIRPTSETIIYAMYSKWINSYRDLPLLLNQWANVVRWEMRTRLFLRTTEFLWQEGHTAHATHDEAEEETLKILDIYAEFLEKFMAVPVLRGLKTEKEKLAGALRTYCVEAMMRDKKALQAGTSHNLGQNFAKAFDVKFQSREGNMEYVWQTSWGVSTRLIGSLIMVHGDDKGMKIPPRLASTQVVVIPIYRDDSEKQAVLEAAGKLVEKLKTRVSVKLDDRDHYSPGWKFNEWELKGIPLRIEIGPKDIKNQSAVFVRRDTGEKTPVRFDGLEDHAFTTLEDIQDTMYKTALKFRDDNTFEVDDYNEFKEKNKRDGGFFSMYVCDSNKCEIKLQEETKATIRVIPLNPPGGKNGSHKGKCILCNGSSKQRVIVAKAY